MLIERGDKNENNRVASPKSVFAVALKLPEMKIVEFANSSDPDEVAH